MILYSHAFLEGEYIPARYAAGAMGGKVSENVNPPLQWNEVPVETKSFVLVCHDPDAPAVKDDVGKTDREVAPETPRQNFYHWLLVDLPADLHRIEEGAFSSGFVSKGKQDRMAAHGTRQGLNDYTSWSKGDPDAEGLYFGYDGPWPPFNDSIPHRYIFTLYALTVEKLDVQGDFTGVEVMKALKALDEKGGVLDKASLTGLYTLNQRLRSGA